MQNEKLKITNDELDLVLNNLDTYYSTKRVISEMLKEYIEPKMFKEDNITVKTLGIDLFSFEYETFTRDVRNSNLYYEILRIKNREVESHNLKSFYHKDLVRGVVTVNGSLYFVNGEKSTIGEIISDNNELLRPVFTIPVNDSYFINDKKVVKKNNENNKKNIKRGN